MWNVNTYISLREYSYIWVIRGKYIYGDLLWGIGSCDYGGWESPTIYCLQARKPGKLVVTPGWVWRPENQGSQCCTSQSTGRMSQPKQASRQERQASSFLCFLLCLVPQTLDDSHPPWGGGEGSNLLNPPIQMLMSSRNTSIDTPRIMFNPNNPWASQVDT